MNVESVLGRMGLVPLSQSYDQFLHMCQQLRFKVGWSMVILFLSVYNCRFNTYTELFIFFFTLIFLVGGGRLSVLQNFSVEKLI